MSKVYLTTQGDMWDSVAYSQLGDISYTDRVMNLNQQYQEYYIFPAGITLMLPDPVIEVSETLPPWKRVSG